MKISVIMPAKDTALYIGACIESIIAQSYENWELIVINDQSSDHTLKILEQYALLDHRIQVFTNPNPGLLQALRLGYSKSSGTLITRMDSDDKMPSYKLEMMYAAWTKYGKGTVITGGADYFSDEGDVANGFQRYAQWLTKVSTQNTHAEHIYKESVIASNCSLVHREDFDKVGGFEPDVFPEDYDLCFRFYAHGLNIIGIPEIVHHWRDRQDRISRNWDVYKDNRFFELKIHYFFEVDRNVNRPLVIWGAGRNAKDLVKLILKRTSQVQWVCNNHKKIGKDIYDIRLKHFEDIQMMTDPQILIVVASPDEQDEIKHELSRFGKVPREDYWFFS